MSNTSNYALRLQKSLKEEAERVAREENSTLNQFINVAVAEKLSSMRTAGYFAERAGRADVGAVLEELDSVGREAVIEGDEA